MGFGIYFINEALEKKPTPPRGYPCLMKGNSLLLVYNADQGFFNAVSASAHKLISPDTYGCRLCCHTFGVTGMLTPWKHYLEMQPYPVIYLHRDEFREQYEDWKDFPLPAIFLSGPGGGLRVLLNAGGIEQAHNLTDLISLLDERLQTENLV